MAPVQFLINTVTALMALFLIHWSKNGNFSNLINATFQHRKLTTPENQADHLSDVAYFYAIYIICLSTFVTFIRFLQGSFNQAIKPDTEFISHLNKIIANSTEHFFIFMSVYVYLIQQKGCNRFFYQSIVGLNKQHILLMPLWFFIGRIGSLIQSLITQVIKSKFSVGYFGIFMTMAPYLAMIGNIFGQSPLSWF